MFKFSQRIIKNTFAIAFAICAMGLIIKAMPEYFIFMLEILGLKSILISKKIDIFYFTNVFSSFQILLGSFILFFCSIWLIKHGKEE